MKKRMNENIVDENNIPSISYDRIFLMAGWLLRARRKYFSGCTHYQDYLIHLFHSTFTRNDYMKSINAYTTTFFSLWSWGYLFTSSWMRVSGCWWLLWCPIVSSVKNTENRQQIWNDAHSMESMVKQACIFLT